MTPKEKAQELVNKFREFADGIDSETDRFSPNIEKKNAKRCALIAVDELIRAIPDASDDNSPYNSELLWWKEVRNEIEKL